MAYLQLRGIEKSFGDQRVIKGIDLEIQQGEFVVFHGVSRQSRASTAGSGLKSEMSRSLTEARSSS